MVGLSNVLTLTNVSLILGGTLLGLFVGAMPGLSATMALALLLPLTFTMDPATGLSMLASLYVGASYGGSIAAILLRTPGTPSAAATVLDGFPLSQQGQAGKALGISLFASFFGGLMSGVALLTAAPLLGVLVLKFGPVELFAIAVLGITIIGSLSQGSIVSGLLSGVMGLLLSTVGMDLITGTPRMTFGNINLFSGIEFTVALIGLFSIPQALILLENAHDNDKVASKITDRLVPRFRELRQLMPNILRSGGIGIVTGLIPGTGGDTASWFAYNEAKRFAKDKSRFGKGDIAGVAAPESANNAVVGGALIPTIALGIPGSSSTAILLGALMVQGILPGPNLLTDYGDVTYTLIWAVILANVGLLAVGLAFTRVCVGVTKVPDSFVACAIITLCVIGAFAINNSLFEVGLMLGFGLFGYWMNKAGISPAPMVIGLILGPVMETSFQQSMLIGQNSPVIFLNSPIAMVLLGIAVLSILQATPFFRWLRGRLTGASRRGRTG
ncbi:tripartite tricarboxylate transporter permease [Halomonas sp. DP4Y7-1]|nr:tripartite tricarboxylate transporter permease [Halomonas sp. DP4Y7-2]MBY5930710.1 tripartite tricarboxylate transporter permease [Halomonas sp. DP8Y7-3]MBY5984868.1 tripartite tricarboxylate transporter permease [Halomonas sp. DP5Y7-2]MBY6207914.1 tripartite tricarboxylate transporter permease [Halomonas sp. DP3Y7-2]MBY6228723.1 tripartite tricarboxylate transporter permease [Halomonas sp. DP3Y7-1]MBY6232458.1 tripartite tricarboxylate transporter permease [Halomonas sp. DP4Y7-1]